VILGEGFPLEVLDDSKKLSPQKREAARRLICERAPAWGIGWASAAEIDRINILRASLLAMERAFAEMAARWAFFPDRPGGKLPAGGPFPALPGGLEAVADGLYSPALPVPCAALVKADASVPEVMAASILAKTARDRLMELYGALYPEYGYARHKGYPTRAHRAAIAAYGPSPIQRMSFAVKACSFGSAETP
jgi:ribonuclease HII